MGSFVENWSDTVTADEQVHEHLQIDEDWLVNAGYGPYSYSQHNAAGSVSDWTDTKQDVSSLTGGSTLLRFSNGTTATSNSLQGNVTKQGTHTGSSSWFNTLYSTSGSMGPISTSFGPDTTAISATPNPWFGAPRDYFSGGVFFAGEPSVRHAEAFGKQLGSSYRTKTYPTLYGWQVPLFSTYYAHPVDVVPHDLPARPVFNGHAAETGGPSWAAERDGAERLRNVEQIRGLARADAAEVLLTKPIGETPVNPWTTYGSLAVASLRISAAVPAISELSTNVVVSAPASEMQGFAETLRRYYQSEETAKQLDERDRNLTMPPRTVADATTQLSGWLAQVAMSNGKLELNDDTLRLADSGKEDDGGREETELLEVAYQQDVLRGSAGNDSLIVMEDRGGLGVVFVARNAPVLNSQTEGSELERANGQKTGYTLGVEYDHVRERSRTNPGFYVINARSDQALAIFVIVQSAKELNDEISRVQSQLWRAGDFRRRGPWLARFSEAPNNWKRTPEEKQLQAKIQELQIALEDLRLEFDKKGYDRFEIVGVPTGSNDELNRYEVRGKGFQNALRAFENSLTKVGPGGLIPGANLGEVYLELTGIRGAYQLAKGGVQLARASVRAIIAARAARGVTPTVDLFAILKGKDVAALSNREVGDLGEEIAKTFLGPQGYTEIFAIKNASNQGIDLMAKTPAGGWIAFEVKTSRVLGKMGGLSARQKDMDFFLKDVLGQASKGTGRYVHIDAAMKSKATEVLNFMREHPDDISGFLIQINTTEEIIRMSPWLRAR